MRDTTLCRAITRHTRQHLPKDAITGPKARAKAPSERNMPMTVPFCWTVPNDDATAVRNVGTVAAANNTIATGLHQWSDTITSMHVNRLR